MNRNCLVRSRPNPYREQIGLNLNLDPNHPQRDSFHRHLLIGIMAVVPEDQFLDMIKQDPQLSQRFTRDDVFGHYLATYHPQKYRYVSEQLKDQPRDLGDHLYRTHRQLYPDQYPEESF